MPRKDVYMKKAMLKVVLPAVAALAVVGSGYAVWYFNGQTTDKATMDLKITAESKIGNIAVTTKDAASLVFDQAARPADVKAGHGANGEGVKFSSATDLTKDTFADMTSKVVSYTADTLTANADAKTLYYRGYMAVPTAVETVIKPTVEAKATAATAADMTKFGTDGFIADDNYTYYTLTMAPASAAENLDQTNLYTIVARTFEYEAAVDTTVENGTGSVIGYQQVKTAVTAAAGKTIQFYFAANYNA
jgi:hypothetical protein